MDELIQKLKNTGFTDYEAKVFLALLHGTQMSASEIAQEAHIHRTDVYNVLRRFVQKGYINEIDTNSVLKYEMIHPDIIQDKIEGKIISQKNNEVNSLKETFKELIPLYRLKDTGTKGIVNVELIRGYNQHRELKFIEIFRNAKREVLYMTRPEYFVSGEIDAFATSFIKKGGIIKSVYEAGSEFRLKTKKGWKNGTVYDLIKTVEKFEKYGEKVRLCSSIVPNITIFDKEIVFININDTKVPKHNEADIIIKSSNFAESMCTVFESFWEKSITIKEFKKKLKK